MIEIVGRRVRVADDEGDRLCFLSGQRAVVGDRVAWVPVRGEGGKLVKVERRRNALRRMNVQGREQILAANLHGIVVVASGVSPPFSPALIDRYLVAAGADGLELAVCVNKIDLGAPDYVDEHLALRRVRVVRTSAVTGEGLDDLRALLASGDGPWALVGHSGVGKTSLIAALLPDEDVGPIGEISDYWDAGRHTTTATRLFSLSNGAELADSPGIRSFLPAGLTAETVRTHFPGIAGVACKYRDCQHREGEDGCRAVDAVPPEILTSYRRLLEEVTEVDEVRRRY